MCTQHHAKCCGEHRRNGRHSLCPLCSYLEVAASQGGGMTAVSTPYPVSGLGSLCYMSVAPQTFTPSQPHPALGIYKAMVGGRKEGARRPMKGLHCLKFCMTDPMQSPGEGSHGALLTFQCLWEPLYRGSVDWRQVGLGLSSFPIFRWPDGPCFLEILRLINSSGSFGLWGPQMRWFGQELLLCLITSRVSPSGLGKILAKLCLP